MSRLSRSPSTFFRIRRSGTDSFPPAAEPTERHRRTTSSSAAIAHRISDVESLFNLNRSLSTTTRTSTSQDSPPAATMRGMERLERRRNMEERNFLKAKARAKNLNPPLDLRLLDYVAPCDDNLMCAICRCPFVDPVILSECDHCFCRECLRQCWSANTPQNRLGPRGDCPTCRTPGKLGPRSSVTKILNNILDDLVAKCPHADEGCKAEVKRAEVQDHVNIYCGYTMIECPDPHCERPVRRKDSATGCLHYPVSCAACRAEMDKSFLESHWTKHCADRKVSCDLCHGQIFYRDMTDHTTRSCPAISVPCPGQPLGCGHRAIGAQAQAHAQRCSLARMAPVFGSMKERLDEQEAAQKQMSRKLEVLEDGFASMHNILYSKSDDTGRMSAQSNSTQVYDEQARGRSEANSPDLSIETGDIDIAAFGIAETPSPLRTTRTSTYRAMPPVPGPRPTDMPEPYSLDFDLASPFPPPATNGPYASPLHHLLSMHESLREEMSRISTALQELDGRHQMQNLNENLRTREEIAYMTAQVAGLGRQVHWLTSAHLQRQTGSGTGTLGSSDVAVSAGPSVEAAISSAVRGAANIVAGGPRQGVRRNTSEEGRTKL